MPKQLAEKIVFQFWFAINFAIQKYENRKQNASCKQHGVCAIFKCLPDGRQEKQGKQLKTFQKLNQIQIDDIN